MVGEAHLGKGAHELQTLEGAPGFILLVLLMELISHSLTTFQR